jgi:hypothetical protein
MTPDPSVERTSSGKLRLRAAAAHVERRATRVPLHAVSGALQYDRHYELRYRHAHGDHRIRDRNRHAHQRIHG